MNRSMIKNTALSLAITIALASLSACNSTAKTTSGGIGCENVNSINLTTAANTVKTSLQTGQCADKFSDYYQDLISVAKGSPEGSNKKVFDDFISWSFNHKIINKLDAKQYFNRYFGERFISLDNTYNTCSQAQKQGEIFSALNQEMQDKKIGFLEVLGDKEGFNKVARQHRDLKTVLEATWMACEV